MEQYTTMKKVRENYKQEIKDLINQSLEIVSNSDTPKEPTLFPVVLQEVLHTLLQDYMDAEVLTRE
jgi:hypothetical protein